MATTGPIGFDVAHLRQEVLATYDDGAAREPEGNGRIFRRLKPRRRLYLADVVVQCELKLEVCSGPDLWAAGVADALPEAELLELTASMGRRFGRITKCFDHFHGISAEVKVARDLHVQAVNFFTGKVAGH